MAGKELSRNPKQIRNWLRRGADPERDKAMLVEIGYKPVSEWDMEELARGRPRGRDGSFRGVAPKWLTDDVQAEAMRRLKENTFGDLMALLPLATGAMRKALQNDDEPKAQLAAAQWLAEQLLGKAKQRHSIDARDEMSPQDFTKKAIASAIILDDGMPEGHHHLSPEAEAYWSSLGREDFRRLDQDEARFMEEEARHTINGELADEDD